MSTKPNYMVGASDLRRALSTIRPLCKHADKLYVILEFIKENQYKPYLYDVRVARVYGWDIDGMVVLDVRVQGTIFACFKLTTPREYAVFEFDKDEHLSFDEEWSSKVEVESRVNRYGSYKRMELIGVAIPSGVPDVDGTYVYTKPLNCYERKPSDDYFTL